MKKYLLILLAGIGIFLFLRPETSSAAIAFVASSTSNNGTGGTSVTSTPMNVATGNLLVVGMGNNANALVVSVTDTAGNTFFHATGSDVAFSGTTDFWFAKNTTSSVSDVVTVNLDVTDTADIFLMQYSGADRTSPFEIGVATTTGVTSTLITSPTFAPASAGNVNVYLTSESTAGTWTPGGNYVRRADGANAFGMFAERLGAPAGNQVATATISPATLNLQLSLASFRAATTFEQSAYRWFNNLNSTQVGSVLTSAQDASTTLASTGAAFRLRTLLYVSGATSTPGSDVLKLQYATSTPGSCGPSTYASGNFIDVATSTGNIRYNNNSGATSGALLTATSTDPTHGADTVVNQTYQSQNNFVATSSISVGQDGKWDFSLIDFSAPANTTYCFRVVYADGTLIATSTATKIPEIKTAAGSALAVSNVVLNGGSAIALTPNVTTTVTVVASTTAGGAAITYATSTIYRSGVGAACTANNLNCYQVASSSCSFSGATTTVSCSANIWYFAQATDASSSFNGQTWQAKITVTDSASNSGSSSTASGVVLNTLLAINVTPASINYGTVLPGASTGSTNQTATVKNAGNSSTTLNLSGTALALGANIIATSSQHYATSTFTFGGAEQVLIGTATAVSGFLLTSPTSTVGVSSPTYWGIAVPSGSATGTYTGTNTFTAVFSP